MKIGFVLECTRDGADAQICGWLAQRQCPGFDPKDASQFKAMTNKAVLMERCGEEATVLLSEGCQHVFVVWDLRPAWPNEKDLDCKREVELVCATLLTAGVPAGKATCVCITKELEVWLLADVEAIWTFCKNNKPGYTPARIPNPGRLEHVDWPKARVDALCDERGRRFTPHLHALQIIKLASQSKLRQVHSYARFEDKLTKLNPPPVKPKARPGSTGKRKRP